MSLVDSQGSFGALPSLPHFAASHGGGKRPLARMRAPQAVVGLALLGIIGSHFAVWCEPAAEGFRGLRLSYLDPAHFGLSRGRQTQH